jgi:hypothetical protein
MSHGCVNLPTDFAGWLYVWASLGTPVVIIRGRLERICPVVADCSPPPPGFSRMALLG